MTPGNAGQAQPDLFGHPSDALPRHEILTAGAVLLRGFALPLVPSLLNALQEVLAAAPFRHMVTPGGFRMSVAMTNCGAAGWISDRSGYRYDAFDPLSGKRWPALPACFLALAADAAEQAGYRDFIPDACLINRYLAGSRLSLHQDRNERDLEAPVVSVSLGAPAVFLFGGAKRSDQPRRIALLHGDVVAWGGPARLHYHGVMPLKAYQHALLGAQRLNLTFRKAR